MKKNSLYKILTPSGFQSFEGIKKVQKTKTLTFYFDKGIPTTCSFEHRFLTKGIEIFAEDLNVGDFIDSQDGKKRISFIVYNPEPDTLYDLINVDNGNIFYSNEIVSHNCDADFLTSGDTFFDIDLLTFYEQTYQTDPLERRGIDGNYWVWESPDYLKSYMVVADVARGDGADSSTCHVIELESCTQVAEYKGKLSPKDFGNFLVGVASEYNGALLVVENANIGWATIEQIIERGYQNLYYSSRNNMETVESYMTKYERDQLIPGFTTSMKTRPLVLAKIQEYIFDKSVIIRSKRTLSEMRVFVWKNGKAQAQLGYNDDLVMALAIGMYVRDTALRMRQQGMDLTRAQLNSLSTVNVKTPTGGISTSNTSFTDPYKIQNGFGQEEDLRWLLG